MSLRKKRQNKTLFNQTPLKLKYKELKLALFTLFSPDCTNTLLTSNYLFNCEVKGVILQDILVVYAVYLMFYLNK